MPNQGKGLSSVDYLTLTKILKIVATRWRILRLKMQHNRFRLGLRPRPRWESLQRSPDPLARFKGRFVAGGGERGGKRVGRVHGMGHGREGFSKIGKERNEGSEVKEEGRNGGENVARPCTSSAYDDVKQVLSLGNV